MEDGSEVMEDIVFRGTEFSVKIELDKGVLIVEISDSVTADQWRGEFDPAYIEDLTRKTGNFKQFPIFCSMLESAVRKTSDSVTLDLLTYADLELLRNRKAGVVSRPRAHQQSSALTAKRYLILIYTVEFDRIHYPLPLPYMGKPDPATLQKEIRALRAELSALTAHGVNKHADLEVQRLRAELAVIKEEKDAMSKALARLQRSDHCSAPGREDWRMNDVVRALEEQLIKERAKSQRSTSKRCQEQQLLVEQLDELRASECALRVRVKSLTNELALLRRGLDNLSVYFIFTFYLFHSFLADKAFDILRVFFPSELTFSPCFCSRLTPVSAHINSRVDDDVYRSVSCEKRSGYRPVRARSGSRERIEHRSLERGRRADSSGPRAHIPRSSPSPTSTNVAQHYILFCKSVPEIATLYSPKGSRAARFDPTAYIQDRQRRLKEAELKKQRRVRRDMLTSPIIPERGRSRSREAYPQLARSGSRGRSLSMERRGSRNSSESSLVDMEEMTKPLFRENKQTYYNGPNVSRSGHLNRNPSCSTPTRRVKDRESSLDRGSKMSEIDARLQALQEYMRDLDTGH